MRHGGRVELRARIPLGLGEGPGPVAEPGCPRHRNPWREPAWGLLARALHHAGRRADAPATLRRARAMRAGRLGLDPGAELQSPAVISGTQSTRT
ncbi:BTAD domain-containing putative transcriptional regulator [Streptomyces leeuwenhoekii]|uniref:BTAD domain-containing putative transcriptional regulator n=1 Tax=Streptomyces leeuwenhoekii TaxID=1437453 RepID=UPI0036FBE633